MSPKDVADAFLLAENRLLRDALVRLLAKKDVRVVGASPYSPIVFEEIERTQATIVLLDSHGLSSPNVIPRLHCVVPAAKLVMVDMDDDKETFLKAVQQGVVGYVLKDASAAEVAATIRAVASGEAVCPPQLSIALFSFVSEMRAAPSPETRPGFRLSRRQQQLIEFLDEPLTNKEIAAQLNLSEQTVKNHIHNILRKLGANDRMSALQLYRAEQPRSIFQPRRVVPDNAAAII